MRIARSIQQAYMHSLKMQGETFRVERQGQIHTVQGVRVSKEDYIRFLAGVDVQAGDILHSQASNKIFYITDTDEEVIEGQVISFKAFYETERQQQQRLAVEATPTPTYSISGNIYGSILGNQQHATISATFDFRALDNEIEQRGGDDIAELKSMVAEIRHMLEENETLDHGAFAKFSSLMERHSWITGAIAQIVLAWAIGMRA